MEPIKVVKTYAIKNRHNFSILTVRHNERSGSVTVELSESDYLGMFPQATEVDSTVANNLLELMQQLGR